MLNCRGVAAPDKSNGYEEIALTFISGRGRNHSGVGASVVADWSQMLPAGATVLDLGCGTGVPISQALIERGFNVHGVDASPTMVAAFRANFPNIPVDCAAVEDSDFFGQTFDGVVAWGLLFLLGCGSPVQVDWESCWRLAKRWQIALHRSMAKLLLARCHDRANLDLNRPRGIPKSVGGRRYGAG